MAKARPTVQKRMKELAKLEKRQSKAAKRAARNSERTDREEGADGIDPDLAGIVAGPQPKPDWAVDEEEEAEV